MSPSPNPAVARVTQRVIDRSGAGGSALLISQLLGAGLLHRDVRTVDGKGLGDYCAILQTLPDRPPAWRPGPQNSGDPGVLRPVAEPFFDSLEGMRAVLGARVC